MKNIFKLAGKMFKRNKLLNFYIIIQMAVVFAMIIFMTSSIISRYKYYTPFKEYLEEDGYFCNLTSATSVLNSYVTKPSDISNAMIGVSDTDVHASYRVNLTENQDNSMFKMLAYCYDKGLYDKWIPKMQEGMWLSKLKKPQANEFPVVIYDRKHSIHVGDTLSKQTINYIIKNGEEATEESNITLKVVGVLDDSAEIVYYNELNYGDCRDIFSPVKKISENTGIDILYLFRSDDIRGTKAFNMSSGIGFINTHGVLTEKEEDDNRTIILGITDDFAKLDEFKASSMRYISEEVNKLLPIFFCILVLTVVITASVNAITTYKEVHHFALYYICGMQWKKTMLISLCHTLMQTLAAMGLAALSCFLCNFMGIFKDTVITFHPLQIVVCTIMIILNLIISLFMPYIIVRKSSPKELLSID